MPTGDGGMASALANAAQAVSGVGRVLQANEAQRDAERRKKEEEDARAYAGERASRLYLQTYKDLEDRKLSATGDAAGFADTWVKDFDALRKAEVEAAPNQPAKKYINDQMNGLFTRLGDDAVRFERDAAVSARTKTKEQEADNWVQAVSRDPQSYLFARASFNDTMPDIGEKAATAIRERTGQRLRSAAVTSLMERDPASLEQELRASLNLNKPAKPTGNKDVDAAVGEYGLPESLSPTLKAIYGQESSSGKADTSQPNYAGAVGPMQIMPATFEGLKRLGLIPADADINNPKDNYRAGVAYIKYLGEKFGNDPDKVAAAYYAGEKAIGKDGQIIDYRDTKNPNAPSVNQYVAQVRAKRAAYETPMAPETQAESGETPEKTGIPFIDDASPEEKWKWLQEARTATQRAGATLRQDVTQKVKNMEALTTQGVPIPQGQIPTEREYVMAYGPMDGVIKYQTEVTGLLKTNNAIVQMQSASPAQRMGMVAASKPDPNSPTYAQDAQQYQAVQRANESITKAIEADPVAYAYRSDPKLAELANNAQTSPQARAQFVTALTAEQERLGATSPKLLTDGQAESIALRLADPKATGEQIAGMMFSLSEQWGSAWPQVYGQLATAGKLPPEAIVIPNMQDRASAEKYARWSRIKKSEIDQQLPSTDKKDIDDRLRENFVDLQQSLVMQGGNAASQVGVYFDAAQRMAQMYRLQGEGWKDATDRAYKEVIGHAYEFNGSYRIPVAQDPQTVIKGTEVLTETLPVGSIVPLRDVPGLKPEDRDRATQSIIRNNAVWANNSDETGLLLYVKGQDGSLYPVMNQTGGQVGKTWGEIRSAYYNEQTLLEIRRSMAPEAQAGPSGRGAQPVPAPTQTSRSRGSAGGG